METIQRLNLSNLVEALVFSSPSPITMEALMNHIANSTGQNYKQTEIEEALESLIQKYQQAEYTFEIVQTGGGYQFLSKPKYHALISGLNGDKFNKRLSTTSMETLSIIAYKQPVTKSEIEYIRGVSSDYSVQKLLEQNLIYISGRDEEAIGKPLLYATTPYFMDYLGINSPEELPQLKEVISVETVRATEGTEAQISVSRSVIEGAELKS